MQEQVLFSRCRRRLLHCLDSSAVSLNIRSNWVIQTEGLNTFKQKTRGRWARRLWQVTHLMGCEVKLSTLISFTTFVIQLTSCCVSSLPLIFGILNYVFLANFKDNQRQDRSGLRLKWQSHLRKLNAYLYYLQFYFSTVSPWNILVDKALGCFDGNEIR